MLILTKNDHKERENSELNRNKSKNQRISQIYSSSQIKDTVQPNKTWKCEIPPKIFNENNGILKIAAKDYNNTRRKNFNHLIENNRVYYY